MDDYQSEVDQVVKSFLYNNLDIENELTSIKKFLERNSFQNSEEYIYYACRGDELTWRECKVYKNIWLHANQVTILSGITLQFNFITIGQHLICTFSI